MSHSFQTNCQLLLYAQLRDQTQLYLVFMNWIGKLKWVALPQCLAYASPVKRKLWCCAVNYLVLIWSTDLDTKSNGGMKFAQVISIFFSGWVMTQRSIMLWTLTRLDSPFLNQVHSWLDSCWLICRPAWLRVDSNWVIMALTRLKFDSFESSRVKFDSPTHESSTTLLWGQAWR